MNKILWKSKNSKWTIEETNKGYMMISDGWSCDYPLRYPHNGQIVYDYPERIPSYVKKQVKKLMETV
jgi:hypothetical protein